jgi:hypothetical protein
MSAVTRVRRVGIASGAILVVVAGLAEVVVGFKDSYLPGLVFLGAETLGRIYLVIAGILPLKGGDAVRFVFGGNGRSRRKFPMRGRGEENWTRCLG